MLYLRGSNKLIHNTSTVIVLSFLISACCEKEGSWLNTVIKDHTAKIAAAAALESKATESTSTLSANAAVISVEKSGTIDLQEPNVTKIGNSDIHTTNTETVEKITGQPESKAAETNDLQLNSIIVQRETKNNPTVFNAADEVQNKTPATGQTITKSSELKTNRDAIDINNKETEESPAVFNAADEVQNKAPDTGETITKSSEPKTNHDAIDINNKETKNNPAIFNAYDEVQNKTPDTGETITKSSELKTNRDAIDINNKETKKSPAVFNAADEVQIKAPDTGQTITKSSELKTNHDAININNTDTSDIATNEKTEIEKVKIDETNISTIIEQSTDNPITKLNDSSEQNADHELQQANLVFDPLHDRNKVNNELNEQNKIANPIESESQLPPTISTANAVHEHEPDKLQEVAETKKIAAEEFTSEESIPEETVSSAELIDDRAKKLSDLISLLNEQDNTAIDQIVEQAKSQVEQEQSFESEADRNQRLLELLSKDIQQPSSGNSKISSESLELLNQILSD